MNETKHAKRLVEQFKALLDEDARNSISGEAFAQLELMVESAIDVSTLEAVNTARDIALGAARDISHIIEKI